MPSRTVVILTLLTAIASAAASNQLRSEEQPSAANWPQWRGPTRDAKISESDWPDTLSEQTLRQVWRVEMGPSYSGPIVSGDRVFVTETRDRKNEVARALDRSTGEELWSAEWQGAMSVPFFAKANGDWIRATPALDEDRLYVAGMRDVLVCLDANNGTELWRVNFVEELGTPLPQFGFVSSPLIVGDHLYVQAGACLAKVDKRTGRILWRALEDGGGMYGSAFSSPFFATLAGKPQLVVQTRSKLAGVSEDGKVLWSQEIPAFRGMNILTPTVSGDSVFTSAYGGRSFMYQVKENGEGLQLDEQWINRTQAYMSSPVVIDGHIYLHLRNQRFTCLDLATGETRWTTRPYGKYWSMVANGDRILALDQRGDLLLIRANPDKFELLDKRKVADDAWAHLAVCNDEIFVRELNALSVYQWSATREPTSNE